MWADNETNEDLLGYQVHADLLKGVVLDPTMLPISIGVFGDWGSGKSTLMLLLHDAVEQWRAENNRENERKDVKVNTRVLQIRFNSWQFEDYEDTKLTLISTILNALSNDIADKKDIFEKADSFLGKIKYLKLGVVLVKNLAKKLIPEKVQQLLPTEEEWNEISKEDQDLLQEEVAQANASKFIERFREDYEKILVEADYRSVIVYIDDLDRCESNRIIQCLEAVKLFVNVKRTAFIIGADERIIENAIHERYKTPLEKTTISSPYSDYLEKLIQLPYKLPKLSFSEQETYVTLLLCSKLENENQFPVIHNRYLEFRKKDKYSKYDLTTIKAANQDLHFGNIEELLPIIPIMSSFLNGNPRQLKRFLNTFDMRRRMAKVAGFNNIRPDVLVKLMVLEYNSLLRPYIDDLYSKQKDTGFVKGIKKIEEQAAEGRVTDKNWEELWNTPDALNWLKSKPSLVQLNLRNYFWISREALQTELPIESRVSAYVNDVYGRLKVVLTERELKRRLNEETKYFTKEQYRMLIMLLNQELCENTDSEIIVRFVNSDSNDKLFSTVQDLKDLLEGVDAGRLGPEYGDFLKRKSANNDFKSYISNLNLSQQLKNAMK